MKNSRRSKAQRISKYLLALGMMLLCCGCGSPPQVPQPTMPASMPEGELVQEEVLYRPDSYDSLDTAVIVKKDTEAGTVTLLSTAAGKKYTLKVEGTSTMYDKHGGAVSFAQMEAGDIVEVTFLKDLKRLNSMQLCSEAWTNASVNRYEIDWERNTISIGKDQYKFSDETLFLSQDKEIEQMDLNAVDVLSFQGIGSSVLSVVVEKGHGYLRLENDSKFIGGFIEIGQSMITLIKDDMLLTVPEGTYQVLLSVEGGSGAKNVTIARNQEVTLDIGDLEVEEPKFGTIIFSMNPSNATLYIDGNKNTDTESDEVENYKIYVDAPTGVEVYLNGNYMGVTPVSFPKEAGTHNLTLRKDGFETRSYTIVVDDEEKDISFSFGDLEVSALNGLESIVID